MKRKLIRLTESDVHSIIRETIMKYLNEDYNKWFQTEENGVSEVNELIRGLKNKITQLDSLSPEEVWESIRQLAYINHSAFKVRPGMWQKYPNETLTNKDYRFNKVIYAFKQRAIKTFIDYYLEHDYDVSTDKNRSIVAFREPKRGIRQITFHLGKDNSLVQSLERNDATWDGVKQVHHYIDDESYQRQREM